MTTHDDTGGHVPGQLQLGETDRTVDELTRELARVRELALLHQATALDYVKQAAASVALDTVTLDQAARDARLLGATWQQIGDAAGIARQNAWRRWRTPEETTEPGADQ